MGIMAVKILVAIESCQAHYDRYQAQRHTWANHELVAVFDGNRLCVPDDYRSLPLKTKAICKFGKNAQVDFLFKVDTDSYVSIDRLLKSGFERHDYTGFQLDHIAGHPYASGPAYWLSSKAINILVEANWDEYSVYGYESCEDVMVGEILRRNGIVLNHDIRYSPFIPVLPENDVISYHLSTHQPYKVELMYEAHKKALGL